MSEVQIVEKAISITDSVYLGLFVAACIGATYLVRYVLKTNADREARYIKVIEEQAVGLQKIDIVQRDVADIKAAILSRKEGG